MNPVKVLHFSDVLCVWAYVSQVRIRELIENFGPRIALDYRYLQVFGDVHSKLEKQWGQQGGVAGYGKHVKSIVAQFDHVEVHPEIWSRNTPSSSMPCHLFLCAVRLLNEQGGREDGTAQVESASWMLRQAFFRDLLDVSERKTLLEIADKNGLPVKKIENVLDSGAAHAALSEDWNLAKEWSVRASPTLMFNDGRQILAGNVGYRVIEANVRELLRSPSDQCSWC